MEKLNQEFEGLMEDVLDMEAEKGELDPLTTRFMNVMSGLQESMKEQKAKEERESLKKRLCAVLDASPLLKVDLRTLATLEELVKSGRPYGGELVAGQLVDGEDAVREDQQQALRERVRQHQQAALRAGQRAEGVRVARMDAPMHWDPANAIFAARPAEAAQFIFDEAPRA